VTLFSTFTALSTLASIIQQLHYATAWAIIKEAQFQKAVKSLTHKGLAFGGAAQIVDQVLFFIRTYLECSRASQGMLNMIQSFTVTMSWHLMFCSGERSSRESLESRSQLSRTVALFTGSWGIRAKWLGEYIEWVGTIAKIFTVVFPGLIVGLINVEAIQDNSAAFIVTSYIASK
jgi:hypothetical protein